ncbi:ATP synthase F1 subunit epsilon [Carboxylicivirga caseinilyticus]|uniref:ATP synthase F1 subunit epsilon n=1 Tax=Carboxylicivirga caseinilyticus TaxID=3417572 RepID=UPI002AA73086|nr:ATP synthase F1 subunit epsilon [uncultured Carboxylicivirga sp.]MCU4163251.1 ATP synthase F1 subunit epsilon [Marinilabiliaceae bacterium A049]
MDLHCEIVTPLQVIYDEPVGMVQVPGEKGSFTVLKGHAPVVSVLSEGTIRVIGKSGHEKLFKCKSGVVECKNNKMVILIHE